MNTDTQLNGHISGAVSTHHGNVWNLLLLTHIGEIPTGLVLLCSSLCDKVGCAPGSASLDGPGTTFLSNIVLYPSGSQLVLLKVPDLMSNIN